MPTLQDHPLRYDLANELHARPFPSLEAPGTVVFIAIKRATGAAGRDRAEDRAHLLALLDRHGAAHPSPDATHHSARIGRHHLKWEQHAEFVTYTAFSDGLSARAFDPVDFEVFPQDWLGQAPGTCMTSVSIRVMKDVDPQRINEHLAAWFVPESLAVSWVMDKAAAVASDFRIDPTGQLRFAIFADPATGAHRIGRIVQRLLEVETYKTMSMLGFSRVRDMAGPLGELDAQLSDLTQQMAEDMRPAEDMLSSLLSISARLETMAAQSAFRFGATKAYRSIVGERIAALRETRFQGRQTFVEFMLRRYDPAMRTVGSTQERLQSLSDRAVRAGELLSTRVDVQRSAQSQKLLESMDRRADLTLRLQHTVEGVSVVAISYYAMSLASYALYPLAAALGLTKGTLNAIVTLPIVAFVWWSVRRIKKRIK